LLVGAPVEELEEEIVQETPHYKHRSHATQEAEERDESVERSLEVIYGKEGKASMRELGHIDRQRSRRLIWAGLGVVLVGLLGFGGFVYGVPAFSAWRQTSEAGVRLTIEGPANILLGEEQSFRISWEQTGSASLENTDLRVIFPAEFQATQFDPKPADVALLRWHLGALPLNGKGTVTVKGVFLGELGSRSAIQALATFHPAGEERTRERMTAKTITFTDTVLTGNVVLPAKVIAGDAVVLRYAVTNRGSLPLAGLEAHLALPAGFLPSDMATSTVVAGTRDVYLPLGRLEPGGFNTVTVHGSFVSGYTQESLLIAEVGRRAVQGVFLAAQRSEVRVPLVAGDLALHFVANGSDLDQGIEPGQPIRLAIGYGNTSPELLKKVNVRLGIESFVDGRSVTGTSLIDWSQLDDVAQGATNTRPRIQTLVYTPKQIPSFEALSPQGEGSMEIGLLAKPVATGTRDAWIKLSLVGTVESVGDTPVQRTVYARPIVLRYRSHAGIGVEPRYFTEEGAPIGYGPLPPTVGTTTAYRVNWRVTKDLHTLKDMVVTAILPKIATFGGKVSADVGVMTYDEATRVLRWSVPEMPEAQKEVEAVFEVQITPTTLDAGRFASLMGETRLEAQDVSLQERVMQVAPAVTTDLQNDEGARGKGVVRLQR